MTEVQPNWDGIIRMPTRRVPITASIDELGLPTRVRRALGQNASVTTIADLVALEESDVRWHRGIGSKAWDILCDALADAGLPQVGDWSQPEVAAAREAYQRARRLTKLKDNLHRFFEESARRIGATRERAFDIRDHPDALAPNTTIDEVYTRLTDAEHALRELADSL